MSEARPPLSHRVTELQVSAHLMQLDTGTYCVFHSPGSTPPDLQTGLPGARLSLPPGPASGNVCIVGFRDDGWLGALDSAALIRVAHGPAQVLMTIYQAAGANQPPRLQVTKLAEGAPAVAKDVPRAAAEPAIPAGEADITAHIQHRGDVLAELGEWVGERGSQRWIEGFSVSPGGSGVAADDLEYQAVLGRDWLSPWASGAQYCGSRGLGLAILGLRVRLRGAAATTHAVRVHATFTDGTAVGPAESCEAASLAPLEAFRIEIAAAPG